MSASQEINWYETGHDFVGERGRNCVRCGVTASKAIHSLAFHIEHDMPYHHDKPLVDGLA